MSEESRGSSSDRGPRPPSVGQVRAEPIPVPFQDIFLVRAMGDGNMAKAVQDHLAKGYRLRQIVWTGNIDAPPQPTQLVTPKNEPTKVGVIPLYLIVFEQLVPHAPQVTLVS